MLPAMQKKTPYVAILTLIASFALLPGTAAAFRLSLPVDCGNDLFCVVQNHVDLDQGQGFSDYRCGTMGYDGHTGTDIRVDPEAMLAGVPVRAAADGVATFSRDGMDDVHMSLAGRGFPDGDKDGNTVHLAHEEGYATSYSHLMKGSVTVSRGDRVRRGQVVGMIGLSGATEFPHLHFGISKNGRTICPFAGPEAVSCGGFSPLWDYRALNALSYVNGGIIGSGVASTRPTMAAIASGKHAGGTTRTAKRLFFWSSLIGVRPGDRTVQVLAVPGGGTRTMTDVSGTAGAERLVVLIYESVDEKPLSSGRYSLTTSLYRNGRKIAGTGRGFEITR